MVNFLTLSKERLRGLASLGLPLGLAAMLPLSAAGQSFNTTKTDYPVGANPRGVAVADVNADGRPDLITANANVSTVSVLLGSSTTGGVFGSKTDYPTGAGAYGVTVADVNADGRPDIITGNATAGTVSVLLNSATTPGTFNSKTDYPAGASTRVVGVVDVNGDGRPDLLAPNASSNTVSVLLNSATTPGTFGSKVDYATAGTPVCVTAADVNADGRPDLLSADYSSNVVSVRLASGTAGSFSATRTPYATDTNPQWVLTADVNADGRPDLVTANVVSNNVSVLLASATTPGTFLSKVGYGTGAGPASVLAADVNADGVLDLITANQFGNSASVLLGSTSTPGTFGSKTDYATGASPYCIAVADVSADLQPDLLTANAGDNTVSVRLAAPPANLTVSSGTLALPVSVASSNYTSITVTGTGVARFDGAVSVSGSANVSGTLLTNCQTLTGPGTFTLASGGTLGICDPAGITATGSTGTVQTAVRSFSPDANYVYNPTATNAATGNALPATVRSLESRGNASGLLNMSQSVQVRQRLILTSGSFGPGGANQTLTLLSDANGTALVVDAGGSAGGNGTNYLMQRYIGQNTGGNGYRHFSSPMDNERLSTLATAGYTPDFTGGAAYNASATPGTTTPFPTVFGYDETRTANAGINFGAAFDRGWLAATAGSQAMTVGQGYSVNAPGTSLVDFQGRFTTGDVTLGNLTYTGADGGWQLLGNPYPAPLDWSTVSAANRPNMNAAMYVFQSTGPYAGTYRPFVSGFGDPVIPAGSGFFVRTAAQGTSGSVTLTNANRVTAFGPQPVFGRGTADLRPQVKLTLGNAANTLADDLTVYADPAATTGIDAEYDATKLPNSTGLNLSVVAATGAELAIAGLPALTAATVLPLHLQVPATGTYQLAATLANLPSGLTAYLRDLTTGTQNALTASTTLTLTAGLSTRYALAFATANALATAAGLTAAQVAVFPNPAAKGAGVTVTLPVAAGQQATAEVRDALGRVVLPARALAVRGGQATAELPTASLAPGVYVLRLTAGTTAVSKRLVVE